MNLDELLSQSPLPDLVTIIGHSAREPMSPESIRRFLAGVSVKVGLDHDTHKYLKKLSVESGRYLWEVVNVALSTYGENPGSFRQCLVDEAPNAHVTVKMSAKLADYYLDEAFCSPVPARSRFIGCVVRDFLQRKTFGEMAEWFTCFMDVMEVLARKQFGESPEAEKWLRQVKTHILAMKRREEARRTLAASPGRQGSAGGTGDRY